MSRQLPRSLQGRLTALVLGLVTVVWLGTAAMTWRDARHELDELLDSHLAQAAALLVAQQSGEPDDDDDDQHVDAPLLHRYATRVAFQVWHGGRLAQRSANAPAEPMLPAGQAFRTGLHTLAMADGEWRIFAAHGAERDVQVYVGEQTRSRSAILWAVLRSTLWPLAIALPLLALGVWWAVRRGTAPLRRLGRTLGERDPGALTLVTLDGAPSEMAPMLEALNGLFERIGALIETERRFTADAAHELRTPIAAIRAQAQVADAAADDAERRHALHAVLLGCDRATRLVEQLLTLSRLEAGDEPASTRVDLGALVRRVVAELASESLAKGQSIDFEAPQACIVAADESLLGVLARNLIDNAIRYSPTQATVRVRVDRDGPAARLVIDDSGPGLSEPDRCRLGERFFRVLGSGQSGSGLGWSIVRRIAAVQSARVRVGRSADLGGLRVELTWPAPPAIDARSAS